MVVIKKSEYIKGVEDSQETLLSQQKMMISRSSVGCPFVMHTSYKARARSICEQDPEWVLWTQDKKVMCGGIRETSHPVCLLPPCRSM